MATLKSLQKETNKYKGKLVIDSFKVVLFLGIEETEEDFYYKYVSGREEYSSSCVGRFIPLKVTAKDYKYLVMIWNYNNPVHKAK